VFGRRQDPNGAYASVIPAWIGALLRGQVPYINGDGAAARDFCHVDNVVQANLLAATVEEPLALGQAYNIALGDQTSLLELYAIIRDHVATKDPAAKGVRALHRSRGRATSCSRAPIPARRSGCWATARQFGSWKACKRLSIGTRKILRLSWRNER